jgi:nitroreductase
MKIMDLIQKRCSIRDYSDKPIEQEKLDYIIEAARLAPSACNLQPWRILIIQSDEGKEKIQMCYGRDWFKTAPLYMVICGDHSESWKRNQDEKDHADIDIAIATEHICLAAVEQGLGTCWVCHFDAKRCSELFNIPEDIEPIVIIPIGYPSDPDLFDKTPKKRKPINEIVISERF